jgi:hypothetical protein
MYLCQVSDTLNVHCDVIEYLQHKMQTQETEKEVFVVIVHFGPHRLSVKL